MTTRPDPVVDALSDLLHNRKPGTVLIVDVAHDRDCPKLKGGECRCKPDVHIAKKDSQP